MCDEAFENTAFEGEESVCVLTEVCDEAQNLCVKCFPNKMFGSVQRSVLNLEALVAYEKQAQIDEIIEKSTFNEIMQNECLNEFKYDTEGDFFSFSILLGECAMNATKVSNSGKDYIQFSGND